MKLSLLILSLLLVSATASSKPTQDEDFIAAREAYRSGNKSKFDKLAPRLRGYTLEPYIDYWQLRMRLAEAEAATVKAFLQRYRDTLLSERMQSEWLKTLAQRRDWLSFGEMYAEIQNEDAELFCYALQYRRQFSGEVLNEARNIWFSGQETPESCEPLFGELFATKVLQVADIWSRFRLAAEAGNWRLVQKLNALLPSVERIDSKLLEKAHRDPEIFLAKKDLKHKTRAQREVVLYALGRVAREEPLTAHDLLVKWTEKLPRPDSLYAQAQLAFHAARRHLPDALGWYRKAEAAVLNDQQLAWKARAALRMQAWPEVLKAIQAMSLTAQQEPAWRYWKARALKEQGKGEDAQLLLAYLSQEHHFYGLLAAEDLGQTQTIKAEGAKPAKEIVSTIEKMPSVQRALKFFELGQIDKTLRIEGVREWVFSIRNLNDLELLAAATVAERHKLYDRAINTADKTVVFHDFGARYLTPYREAFVSATQQQGLDLSIVFGLVRQESRFIADAISSAGAVGLMQLMPPTAKWVAKKLGASDYRPSHIGVIDTNIQFGTFYFRQVLDRLDGHALLAAAAYNAGPGRAQAWRAHFPLEGAIYAETIPFSETRDYVKKVMANAMYYAQVLGQPAIPLKERLGVVAPRKTDTLMAGVPADKMP